VKVRVLKTLRVVPKMIIEERLISIKACVMCLTLWRMVWTLNSVMVVIAFIIPLI